MAASLRRNVILLALCQALFMTGNSMVLTVTALAGESLKPDSGLATLPLALQFIATMAATVPASFIMRRFGRRAGFIIGAAAGGAGGLVNLHAISHGDFGLFCAGSALFGVLAGFASYYRFAAADSADEANRSRAISLVLSGGVIAAFTGPNLARATVDAFPDAIYAGSYAALAVLQLATIALLAFVDIPRLTAAERRDSGRPFAEIVRAPVVPVAVLAAVAGYSAMTLVMTATPLAMMAHRHGFSDAAIVIQWHVLAMFAPAFVTGHLIRRFGALPVIAAGAVLILTCAVLNLQGGTVAHFTAALVALGVGWSFMFIGGTSLLTAAITRPEQAKVQGINDFLVFGAVSAAALSSGALQTGVGWNAVNLAAIPGVGLALLATLWLWGRAGARAA